MVSQWPPKLPKWSNLVQFDFQQKHPGPAKDSPLQRESSTKCAHRIAHGGWLRIDGYPSKLQPSWKHRKTAKNIGKRLKWEEVKAKITRIHPSLDRSSQSTTKAQTRAPPDIIDSLNMNMIAIYIIFYTYGHQKPKPWLTMSTSSASLARSLRNSNWSLLYT